MHATLDDWIRHEAISLSLFAPDAFNSAVDQLIAALGDKVEVLGIGEPLHGETEFLILRNRLFQRLVECARLQRHCRREQFSEGTPGERVCRWMWPGVLR